MSNEQNINDNGQTKEELLTRINQLEQREIKLTQNLEKLQATQKEIVGLYSELKQQSEEMNLVQQVARIGSWEIDLNTKEIKWNDMMFEIFGIPKTKHAPSFDRLINIYHPDDKEPYLKNLLLLKDKGTRLDQELRLTPNGKEVITTYTVGIPLRDDENKIVKTFGLLQDITERKRSEESLAKIAVEQAALNELSLNILNRQDSASVYDEVTKALVEKYNISTAGLWIFHKEGNKLVLQASAGETTRLNNLYGSISLNSDSRLAWIAQQREANITNNLKDNRYADDKIWIEESVATTFAGYPLFAGTDLLGVLGMFSNEHISEETLLLFQSLAILIGTVVNTQYLFDQANTRAKELAIVAEVGTQAATTLDPHKLLQSVAELTKNEFGLYHVHIYLLNETNNTLNLAAGAGDVGRQMVAEGWKVPMTQENSVVVQVAKTKQGVIVNNTSLNPEFMAHPLLPDTRSELAVPMIVGDKVLGVLDAQANVVGRFSEEDVHVQTTLAEQVAVALQNARLFERSEQALQELNALTRRLTREGWEEYIDTASRFDSGYVYDLNQMLPIDKADIPTDETAKRRLTKQLSIQGETIGCLTMVEPQNMVNEADEIMAVVAERLSAHLENLRLSEQTQTALDEQQQAAFLMKERVKELDCLNDVGRRIAEVPPVPEFLQWVTERITSAMRYPDVCVVALEYNGHIYGRVEAIELPTQIVSGLRAKDEFLGQISIAYTEKHDFIDEESALLGGISRRVSNYIKSQNLLEQIQDALAGQQHLALELESQRRTLEAVLQSMPTGVVVVEAKTNRLTLSNRQAQEILGSGISLTVKTESTIKQSEIYPIYRYGTDDIYPEEQLPLRRGLAGETVTIDDMEVKQPDGSRILLEITGLPIYDAQAEITDSLIIFQDITRRKKAEIEREKLLDDAQQSQQFLDTVLDSIPNPIFFKAPDGTYLGFNHAFLDYSGKKREDLIGQDVYSLTDEKELADRYREMDIEMFNNPGINEYEMLFKHADGSFRDVVIYKATFNNKDGSLGGLVGTIIDITERKVAEVERERLLEEAEAAYRQFVSKEWDKFLVSSEQGRLYVEHYQGASQDEFNTKALSNLQNEAVNNGKIKTTSRADNKRYKNKAMIAAPISLRGHTIGTVGLQDIDPNRKWTAEELALVETVSEQLALTVENLRLFGDTQQRVAREQLTREITDKMRSSPDVDSIIKSGLTELAKALGVSRTYVKLTTKLDEEKLYEAG